MSYLRAALETTTRMWRRLHLMSTTFTVCLKLLGWATASGVQAAHRPLSLSNSGDGWKMERLPRRLQSRCQWVIRHMIGFFAPIQPSPISAKPAEILPEPIAGPVPACCRPTPMARVMVRQDMILDLTNSSCVWLYVPLRNLGLNGNSTLRK